MNHHIRLVVNIFNFEIKVLMVSKNVYLFSPSAVNVKFLKIYSASNKKKIVRISRFKPSQKKKYSFRKSGAGKTD